ncbi:MAG: DUF4199 domain-containing protein [Bacteroidetes bacterium]|nr:DUF4199 domain-containing protein [Bacteroidota bacterium]
MEGNLSIKTALHYGSLSGLSVFVFFVIIHFMGYNVFGGVPFLGFWIPVVFIIMASKFHRDHNLQGVMTYWQGFTIGIFTTFFSAALFGLAFYLFTLMYAPELLDQYKTQALTSMEEGKAVMSDAVFEKAMEGIEEVTIGSLAFSESFNKLLGGLIISFITAAIYRRKPQQFV